MAQSCDIAIVGGGLVGAALCLALDRLGFDVRLLERGAAPGALDADPFDARVYAISPGSAAFLGDLGVWPAVLRQRAAAYESMRIWSRDGARKLSFSAADLGTPCLGWIVEQQLMLSLLWQALPAATRLPGSEVRGFRSLGDQQQILQLQSADEIHARLVISAEGANAVLRDIAGITAQGWSYEQQAVVCHLETSVPHRGTALQRFLPDGPLAFLPLPDGRRSIVWSTTPARARQLIEMPAERFHQQLAEAIQHETGTVGASTRRISFPLRGVHAQQYVSDGFALIGDSAHVVHPLAGQGVNLGLADAAELARVLGEARAAGRNWSGVRVLRRYERARQAQNQQMLALTDSLNRAFRVPLPGLSWVLGSGLSLIDRVPPLKRMLMSSAMR